MLRIQTIQEKQESDRMREDTSMRIKRKTKKRFDKFGHKGETDDQLLNRLLDELEEARKK